MIHPFSSVFFPISSSKIFSHGREDRGFGKGYRPTQRGRRRRRRRTGTMPFPTGHAQTRFGSQRKSPEENGGKKRSRRPRMERERGVLRGAVVGDERFAGKGGPIVHRRIQSLSFFIAFIEAIANGQDDSRGNLLYHRQRGR